MSEWYVFDNTNGVNTAIGNSAAKTEAKIQAPGALPVSDGSFVRVDIHALARAYPWWAVPVHAYFRHTNGNWKLIGLDRAPIDNGAGSERWH